MTQTLHLHTGCGKTEAFIYLSGAIRPETLDQRPDLGVLFNPLMGNSPDHLGVHAHDNGVWSEFMGERNGRPKPFSLARFLALLDKWRAYQGSCLFANAPDRVGDWRGTLERSVPVFNEIRRRGYKVGFCAQNDLEYHLAKIPWSGFDVLFLGGGPDPQFVSKTNPRGEWKCSRGARRLVDLAHAKGKRIHMGRVNSWLRVSTAAAWGCHSADGMTLVRHPKGVTFATTEVQSWLDRLNTPERIAA